MKKPPPPFFYENMEEDFTMPYKIYGQVEYEVLKDKYMRLNNMPKSYLHRRYLLSGQTTI